MVTFKGPDRAFGQRNAKSRVGIKRQALKAYELETTAPFHKSPRN
jgi:hypothetical protein